LAINISYIQESSKLVEIFSIIAEFECLGNYFESFVLAKHKTSILVILKETKKISLFIILLLLRRLSYLFFILMKTKKIFHFSL